MPLQKEPSVSQVYHVEVKSSVKERFSLSDRLVRPIALTPILSESEMRDIMATILQQRGFQETAPNQWTAQGNQGETIIYDLEKMEMQATLEQEKILQTDVQAKGSAYDKKSNAKENARQALLLEEAKARDNLKREAETIQRQLTQNLLDTEQERLHSAHQILQEVYAESLKRKARQLGEVMDIRESTSQGQYELVIRVSR